MKPTQHLSTRQELSQQLRLSPLQIKVGRLLELNPQALDEEINKLLEENPAVQQEITEPAAITDYPLSPSVSGNSNQYIDEPFYKEATPETLSDHLNAQLDEMHLNDLERQIANFVIGNIDSNGYFRSSDQEIADDMAFQSGLEVTPAQVDGVIKIIQSLEPAGIAARDLKECLLRQISLKENETNRDASVIVTSHLQDVASHNYSRIIGETGMTKERFRAALALIQSLNPRPGLGFGLEPAAERASHISPEYSITPRYDGTLEINPLIPHRRLTLSSGHIKETAEFKEAKMFLTALSHRDLAIDMTVRAIVSEQKDFFLSGDDSALHPLRLKDLATLTELDLSTLSRVTNERYVQTPWGTFELKRFLVTPAPRLNEVSRESVLTAMKDLVDHEDKSAPLTDEQLREKLSSLGYELSRRTVVKYRGFLSIPPARQRRPL